MGPKSKKHEVEFIGNTIPLIFDADDKCAPKSYKLSKSSHSPGYIPIEPEDWINSRHVLYDTKLLTIHDPKFVFETDEYFKGKLYDPQATLLYTMIKLENKQCLEIFNSGIVYTKYGILSVKFSFGKTVLALALICAQKCPAEIAIKYPLLTIQSSSDIDSRNKMNINAMHERDENSRYNNFKATSHWGFFPEVESLDEEIIPFSIVAAASSIITQWEQNIKKFTNLKYHIIDNVHSLKKFENISNEFFKNQVLEYDLILVKIGHITQNYRTAKEIANGVCFTSNRTMFSAIRSIIGNNKIARFIIDDFDVVKLTGYDYLIPACFTWFISATRRQSAIKCHSLYSYESVEEYISYNLECPAITYTSDDVLNNVFNIRCDAEYIDNHINTTNIIFRKIVVVGSSTKILQNLNIAPEIIEMINADAVGLAAQALGMEVSSIGELIQRITGNHLREMKFAMVVLNRIDKLIAASNAVADIAEADTAEADFNAVADTAEVGTAEADTAEANLAEANLVEADTAEADTAEADLVEADLAEESKLKLNSIRKIIMYSSDKDFMDFIEGRKNYLDMKNNVISINNAPANNLNKSPIEALRVKMTLQYEKNSTTLNRMRDNIREGYCQCCSLPFDDNCAYILGNCCQIVICEDCITVNNFGSKSLIKKCPNCAVELTYTSTSGLIKVGNNINLEDALSNNIITDVDITPSAPVSTTTGVKNNKIKALIQLLNNEPIECVSNDIVLPYISGLLIGRQDIPHTGKGKYLIFSLLTETTHFLSEELRKQNIPHQILQGTRVQKHTIIEKFEHEYNILLVTATNDCAGLHLPFVSHIIFYHKIIDHNIESQIAARGQRLGRKSNLEIISLLYQYE
jgi:uncharacterized protein YjbI with pentapeptide repeats